MDLINVRFYLNPYTLIIEPIPTDNSYNLTPFNLSHYRDRLKSVNQIFTLLYEDKVFRNAYKKTLIEIKSNIENIENDNQKLCKKFEKYCSQKISITDLKRNISQLIKIGDNIFPIMQDKNIEKKEFDLKNVSSNKSELEALKIYDNYIYARLFTDHLRVYNNTLDDILIKSIIVYKNNFENKCKTFKTKNCIIKKHEINVFIDGSNSINFEKILIDYEKESIIWAELKGKLKNENFKYFLKIEDQIVEKEFFTEKNIKKNNSLIILNENTYSIGGNLLIKEPIIIPKNFNLVITPGSNLSFDRNSFIYINGGNLIIDGKDDGVKLKPIRDYWRGIYVNNSKSLSKIINADISSTKFFNYSGISLTGGINFYNSDVDIKSSSIINSKSEDAINIINSNFKIIDSRITGAVSDGIDSDFSKGLIKNTLFENIGGDAIDTSGSTVNILSTEIFNINDKALSAGEESDVYIEELKIDSARFGIVSKDLSKVKGSNINITNSSEYDIMAFEKKMHYGPGFIEVKNVQSNDKFLSQEKSIIIINNKKIKNKKFNSKKFY